MLKQFVFIKKLSFSLSCLFICLSQTIYSSSVEKSENNNASHNPIISIDTYKTILKVRTAKFRSKNYIIGSSYEGTIIAIDDNGEIAWENKLSGLMNHDIWCRDIDNDGYDEILAANADGSAYCIDHTGKTKWQFQPNEVPMYSICAIEKNNIKYVVCGGLDLNIYYLTAEGRKITEIPSSSYSINKAWGRENRPYNNLHYANFIRTAKKDKKTEILVVHGSNNHMQGTGVLYLFNACTNKPYNSIEVAAKSPLGEMRIADTNDDDVDEVYLGFSGHHGSANVTKFDLNTGESKSDWNLHKIKSRLGFGYSVLQPELIDTNGENKILMLIGDKIVITDPNFKSKEELIKTKYSYHDIWKDGNKLIFASSQSGGSSIHIIDTESSNWKSAYEDLEPKGKIATILQNTDSYRDLLKKYNAPKNQRPQLPVYMMTENLNDSFVASVAKKANKKYDSPIFLGGGHLRFAEDWDRSNMQNEKYRNKRDRRKKYEATQKEAVNHITKWYSGKPGIAYWGGHGNDPYMFQLETTKKIIDKANGKKTVLIYPELEDHTKDFEWVMNDLFYPLADYAKGKNANIFVRTKHNFWQGNIYLPMWDKAMNGNYADVFVPSMEETTDKAMDISIAARSGIWASGAFNNWGTRAVPDNPSYDRSRQFSHQRLPNHFLRHIIYHIASGATYINNFGVDQRYMSFLWELIGKGALYVPKPNEILSYSPVHLSMKTPDHDYMTESSALKWSVFYNKEHLENNKFVFSRQNATWPGAKNTPWDFSTYAGNVKERRQNYLPNYPNGLVLITPPQQGVFAKQNVKRGKLEDHLHPIYKGILKEYITDGKNYYSADGKETYKADTYYKTIEKDIKKGAEKLPITVIGDVAWVLAQTSPTNLRLTIIDGGYLNPSDKKATIKFNAVVPKEMKDIIDGKKFDITNPKNVTVDVATGLFRFIDIKIEKPL
ncbi:hypothetical protein ACXGQW_09400 [Wenyingzhuangia sp. IMCC45533]